MNPLMILSLLETVHDSKHSTSSYKAVKSNLFPWEQIYTRMSCTVNKHFRGLWRELTWGGWVSVATSGVRLLVHKL